MPSVAAHMIVAKLVSEKLNINDPDFYRGNLLPDIIYKKNSHYKIKGEHFYIPNVSYVKSNFCLKDNLYLGYYVHLLLDKYFLEEYVPNVIGRYDIFKTKEIYRDYTKINYSLIRNFDIDVDELCSVLIDYKDDVDEEKLIENLTCLYTSETGDGKYLKIEDFSKFLIDISDRICEDIKDYNDYSNKKYVFD